MTNTSYDISRQIDYKNEALIAADHVATGKLISQGTLVVDGATTLSGAVTMSQGATPRSFSGTTVGATKTLALSDTGSTFIFDRAAGTTVTLPATTNVGTIFNFVVGTVNSSATNKIITSAGTIFLIGGIYVDKALTVTRYAANGSTHVSLNWDGSTTGGIAGSYVTLRCVSATQWLVEGTQLASGTLATPFATS